MMHHHRLPRASSSSRCSPSASWWRAPAADLGINSALGTALTVLFVASLAPVWRADRAIAQGNASAMVTGLGATFVLGLVALLGIVYDWRTLSLDQGSR